MRGDTDVDVQSGSTNGSILSSGDERLRKGAVEVSEACAARVEEEVGKDEVGNTTCRTEAVGRARMLVGKLRDAVVYVEGAVVGMYDNAPPDEVAAVHGNEAVPGRRGAAVACVIGRQGDP